MHLNTHMKLKKSGEAVARAAYGGGRVAIPGGVREKLNVLRDMV